MPDPFEDAAARVRAGFEQSDAYRQAQREQAQREAMARIMADLRNAAPYADFSTIFNDDMLRDSVLYGMGARSGAERINPEDFQRNWDFGREYVSRMRSTPPPPPARDPKTMQRLRDLKRMRDGTTYEGERTNAQSAMNLIMAKHGITESEI